MKYINKQHSINAIKWTGKNEVDVYNFLEDKNVESSREVKLKGKNFIVKFENGRTKLLIINEYIGENLSEVKVGDYIIKINNHLYISNFNNFEKEYEELIPLTDSISFMKEVRKLCTENEYNITINKTANGYSIFIQKEKYNTTKYVSYDEFTYNNGINLLKLYIQEINNILKKEEELVNMNFGEAIEKCKQGSCIARKGWDGKDQFVFLVKGNDLQTILKYGYCDKHLENNTTIVDVLAIKTSANQIQIGWLATQTDMLATDWYVVK